MAKDLSKKGTLPRIKNRIVEKTHPGTKTA